MKLSHLVGMLVVGGLAAGVQVGAAQYGGSDTAKKPAAKPAAAKAGGAHSMTGCLAKGTEPNTWMLTNIEGKGPKEAELVEVPATGFGFAAAACATAGGASLIVTVAVALNGPNVAVTVNGPPAAAPAMKSPLWLITPPPLTANANCGCTDIGLPN